MPPRKKTVTRKKAKKKTIRRGSVRRETPLEKLAFRVSILEEGFDEIEKQMREMLPEIRQAMLSANAKPEAIDVAPEPAHVPDEPIASENE
jgi:hypothetical protein